jgi:hypothetical protein
LGTKRSVRLITLLIIAFFIFQLLPVDLSNAEGLNVPKYNTLLSSNSIYTEAALLPGRLNLGKSYQKIQARDVSLNISKAFADDIPVYKSFYQTQPVDFRRIIRQTIPHFFNGTKYKDSIFVT